MRRGGVAAPILMLSGRCEPKERALGLSAGADDFVAKPFDVEELVARVRALLRRTMGFGSVRCGDLEIDPRTHEARLADVTLTLTQVEHALLLQLARREGYVVERAELLAHVWGLDFDPASNVVEVHVGRVRQKLGQRAWMIETVRGVGYRLLAQRKPRSPAEQ
jgi:DNA-binding response OmpR family regulator